MAAWEILLRRLSSATVVSYDQTCHWQGPSLSLFPELDAVANIARRVTVTVTGLDATGHGRALKYKEAFLSFQRLH